MKAKIKFLVRPTFNSGSGKLAQSGLLVGRAHDRRMWTLCFESSTKLNELEYVGDLRWLANPVEQDFGPGVRFVIVDNPKAYVDGTTLGVLAVGELLA